MKEKKREKYVYHGQVGTEKERVGIVGQWEHVAMKGEKNGHKICCQLTVT